MTGAAILTVIATILSVESGFVEIDLGRNGGLQAGDEGVIFYEIGVSNEVKSVEVGKGTVFEASSYTAKLQMRPGLDVRSGYLIRFEIPVSRVSAARGERPAQASPLPAGQVEAFVTSTEGSCLNVRPLPSTVMPAIGCVAEGARVTVIDSAPDWKKTRLEDGREGWVAARFLSAKSLGALPTVPRPPREAAVTNSAPRPKPDPRQAPQIAAAPIPAPKNSSPDTRALDEAASQYELSQRSMELTDQLRAADAEVTSLLQEAGRSHEALSEAERRQTELRRRLLETTVTDLESRLQATRSTLARTEDERSDLMTRIANLEAARDRLEGDAAESEAARRTAADEAERLRGQLAEGQESLARVSAERDRLAGDLEASRADLAQLETVAEAAKEALRLEVRNSETTANALRQELAAKDERITALEAESQTIAAQLAKAESGSRWRLRRELKRTQKTLRLVEADRAEAEARLAQAQATPAGTGGEVDDRVAALTAERDQLAATIARLERRNPTPSDPTRGDLEAELADARYHIAELEIRLGQREREENPPVLSQKMASGEIEDLSTEMAAPARELVVLRSAEPCLNFRAEPSLVGRVFECLEPGTAVGRVGRWEGWLYVELPDMRAGWVAEQHVGPVGVGGG